MVHTLGHYKHIIDGKISDTTTPHPLEGYYDKDIFIKRFVSHFKGMTYEDISDGNKKLFKVKYNNCEYNIYIEAFDGGGRDRTDGSKKISITGSKSFKKLIDNGESVLIVNEYVPLIHNQDGQIVLDDISVYGIIKPEEIYSSKVVRENTGNPSSRWVSLETMLECLEQHKLIMNNVNNVYVVPSDLISSYFDLKIIDEQYEEMSKYIFETEDDVSLSDGKISKIFRDRLVSKRGLQCEFCNCNVDVSDQLIASHIYSKSDIRSNEHLSDEEKFNLMSDVYNGFLLCRTHDALFDKYHVTLTNSGELIVAPEFRKLEKEFNIAGFEGKKIIDVPEQSIKYLEHHRKTFCNKNYIDDLDALIMREVLISSDENQSQD